MSVPVVFSRHARRRMKLYRIDPIDVVAAIELHEVSMNEGETYNIVDELLAAKYMFPIKIVFIREKSENVVITAYPLKKGRET